MRILILAIALLSTTAFAPPVPGLSCAEVSRAVWERGFSPHLGTEEPFPPLAMDLQSKWFRLGKGLMGGTVYRVVPQDGRPPYIIKKYEASGSCKDDMKAFDLMQDLFAKNPKSGFGVIDYRKIDETTLRLPDIYGRNLLESYDFATPPARKKLEEKYNHLLDLAAKQLEVWFQEKMKSEPRPRGRYTQRTDILFPELKTFSLSLNDGTAPIEIFLKPDNILIDRDGVMWIIDPF